MCSGNVRSGNVRSGTVRSGNVCSRNVCNGTYKCYGNVWEVGNGEWQRFLLPSQYTWQKMIASVIAEQWRGENIKVNRQFLHCFGSGPKFFVEFVESESGSRIWWAKNLNFNRGVKVRTIYWSKMQYFFVRPLGLSSYRRNPQPRTSSNSKQEIFSFFVVHFCLSWIRIHRPSWIQIHRPSWIQIRIRNTDFFTDGLTCTIQNDVHISVVNVPNS